MGMFDRIIDLDGKLKCAEGHVLKDFQTKDLTNTMTRFYLRGNRLYETVKTRETLEPGETTVREVKEHILQEYVLGYRTVAIYAACPQCKPVRFQQKGDRGWIDNIGEKQPWNDFELKFGDRALVSVTSKLETRAEIIKDLRAYGVTVIEND